MRRLAVCILLVFTAPAAAADWPYVHAHRAGPQELGKPAWAEETMPAFRAAWEVHRAVLELDVKLSSDRVPVVIHDATLDRTTPCTGPVAARTWAEIQAQCPADVIGIAPLATAPAVPPVALPRLREVLDYAKGTAAFLNIEIKNLPTDADFDLGSAYATTVIEEIKASGFPLDRLIIQSFWPPNLDVAEQQLPGVQTSFLTGVTDTNEIGELYAAARGYEWWSPAWPVDPGRIALAHALGLKVVPYTVDDPDAIRAVRAAGADGVITNDPLMARQALGLAGPPPAAEAPVAVAKPSVRSCRAVRGTGTIRAHRALGSCTSVLRIVRAYLKRGCLRGYRCAGRRHVTLRHGRGAIRFARRR